MSWGLSRASDLDDLKKRRLHIDVPASVAGAGLYSTMSS